jgi:hypothetical protein
MYLYFGCLPFASNLKLMQESEVFLVGNETVW